MAFYAVGGYGGFGNAYVNRKDKRGKPQRIGGMSPMKPASAMQGMKGAAYGGYGGLGNAPKMGGGPFKADMGPTPIGPIPLPVPDNDMTVVPSRPSLPAGTARDRDAYAPARPSPADRERERLERKEMKQERINYLMSLLAKEKYLREQMAGTRLRSQEWHRLGEELQELRSTLRGLRTPPREISEEEAAWRAKEKWAIDHHIPIDPEPGMIY